MAEVQPTLPPQMQQAHERGALGAKNVLGETAFSDAWMAGRAMTIDQAVSLGLGLSASRGEALSADAMAAARSAGDRHGQRGERHDDR